jgi:hypothetical protein
MDLALRLETKETCTKIRDGLRKLIDQEKFGDLELELDTFFHQVCFPPLRLFSDSMQVVGIDSKVARVLKVIHQNIM